MKMTAAELSLWLAGLFEERLTNTAAVIKAAGGSPEEVAAEVAVQREEMNALRNEIVATTQRVILDPEAAEHPLQ